MTGKKEKKYLMKEMPKTTILKPIFPNPTAETKKRIKEVLKKIRKAQSKIDIVDWLCETYGIGEKQASDYYHDALYLIQNSHSNEEDAAVIREEQIDRIKFLMDDALKAGDRKTVTKCQDMLNRIYQLYVEKKEVTVTNDVIKFKFDS